MSRPAEREKLVMALCDRVIGLSDEQREAMLDVSCGDDAALRAEVEELLESIENSGQFMALDDERTQS